MPHLLEGVDLWLVDSLVVPASLHDAEGRFLHMNAAAEPASGNSNARRSGAWAAAGRRGCSHGVMRLAGIEPACKSATS